MLRTKLGVILGTFLFSTLSCTSRGCNTQDGQLDVDQIKTNNQNLSRVATDTTGLYGLRVGEAAQSIIDPSIRYDPTYRQISYPNGDVASDTGVCTDVVIRTYRVLGIDLQKLVHEDMKANFSIYPSKKMWGLKTTDRNIDHRRVPNLQRFFERKGLVKDKSSNSNDYSEGDIVAWKLPNGLLHIGIVIHEKSQRGIPLVVHNIGRGQIAEDVLFAWEIIGHYSYPR